VKALLCREYGPIDRLKVEEVPSPRPGADQVVVEVKASSLNFPDALLVQGLYQVKPPLPFSRGWSWPG
jgi:NADPH2:quinone reductase